MTDEEKKAFATVIKLSVLTELRKKLLSLPDKATLEDGRKMLDDQIRMTLNKKASAVSPDEKKIIISTLIEVRSALAHQNSKRRALSALNALQSEAQNERNQKFSGAGRKGSWVPPAHPYRSRAITLGSIPSANEGALPSSAYPLHSRVRPRVHSMGRSRANALQVPQSDRPLSLGRERTQSTQTEPKEEQETKTTRRDSTETLTRRRGLSLSEIKASATRMLAKEAYSRFENLVMEDRKMIEEGKTLVRESDVLKESFRENKRDLERKIYSEAIDRLERSKKVAKKIVDSANELKPSCESGLVSVGFLTQDKISIRLESDKHFLEEAFEGLIRSGDRHKLSKKLENLKENYLALEKLIEKIDKNEKLSGNFKERNNIYLKQMMDLLGRVYTFLKNYNKIIDKNRTHLIKTLNHLEDIKKDNLPSIEKRKLKKKNKKSPIRFKFGKQDDTPLSRDRRLAPDQEQAACDRKFKAKSDEPFEINSGIPHRSEI